MTDEIVETDIEEIIGEINPVEIPIEEAVSVEEKYPTPVTFATAQAEVENREKEYAKAVRAGAVFE